MQIDQLCGQLLLATPSMRDPRFQDSVILICSYDDEGSMGLIINRPQRITVQDVLDDLKIEVTQPIEQPVFDGGPLDAFRGFVLHDSWHIYQSTMQVSESLHLTGSRDVLEALGRNDGPEHYMLILGYAGWGAGQLEAELADNDWLVAPASEQLIFHEAPENRWAFAASCMGIDRRLLSHQSGHA